MKDLRTAFKEWKWQRELAELEAWATPTREAVKIRVWPHESFIVRLTSGGKFVHLGLAVMSRICDRCKNAQELSCKDLSILDECPEYCLTYAHLYEMAHPPKINPDDVEIGF